MEAVKTVWDLLQEMIEKRWTRFLIGGLFPLIGILLAMQTFFGMQIYTVSGTIQSATIEKNSSSGEYQDTLVALDGGTTHYRVEVNYFTPSLAEDAFATGQRVDLWYEQTPLLASDVVAVQLYDAGGVPTKYTSDAYTDPLGARTGNLITAGVFILLGLLALAAGLWLPAPKEPEAEKGAKEKSSKQATGGYGRSVVGPPRQ